MAASASPPDHSPDPTFSSRKAWGLIALMCLVQVLGMAGNATFPALIPQFREIWGLSNTQAGWIGGIYYAGYIAAVPFLVSLTDSLDARRIYLFSTALGAAATLAFALLAQGFWLALLFRLLAGVGLAGTYMVGLRMLTDRLNGSWQARGVAFYTAFFSVGASFSVLLAGEIEGFWGWQGAFAVAGLATFTSWLLVQLFLPRRSAQEREASKQKLASNKEALKLGPAFRNRSALAYNLGYACHIWELFAYRAWIVAFLVFLFNSQDLDRLFGLTATQLATGLLLLGMPASILGAEAAQIFSRKRVVSLIMLASGLCSLALGFFADQSLGFLLPLLLVFSCLVMADSAALTTGAVLAADPSRKGGTMALHALLGFGAGFVSPLVFGVMLDLGGGAEQSQGWLLGFLVMGLGVALGPVVLRWLIGARETA
ncbi:MFS transporter [Rhodovibrionaceae bacterium A322]